MSDNNDNTVRFRELRSIHGQCSHNVKIFTLCIIEHIHTYIYINTRYIHVRTERSTACRTRLLQIRV